ncbi:MAG TPA: hypothetical protein VGC80_14275, partial [Acetobacteraceae bacterium]
MSQNVLGAAPFGVPAPTSRLASARAARMLELLLVFLVAGAFYVALRGELPHHDVARFATQVNSGKFVWDIAH